MIEDEFRRAEQDYLSKALPFQLSLWYNYVQASYVVSFGKNVHNRYAPSRTIPRSTVVNWREPRLTLNYVGRRMLKDAGLPVRLNRMKKPRVISE